MHGIEEGYWEGSSESSLSEPASSPAPSAYEPDAKTARIGNTTGDGTVCPLTKFLLYSLVLCFFTHC